MFHDQHRKFRISTGQRGVSDVVRPTVPPCRGMSCDDALNDLIRASRASPAAAAGLIKIGVHIVRSVRRIVLHFPQSHPDAVPWAPLARALSALPG